MAIEFEPDSKTATISSSLLLLLPSFVLHRSKSAAAAQLIHLLRRVLLISLRFLILILSPLLPLCSHSPSSSSTSSISSAGATISTPSSRALSHVLSVLSRVPVASRKYEFVRSLADRLLDDNLSSPSPSSLNREALSSAFSRTLRGLESCVVPAKAEGFVSLDLIIGAARRWIAEDAAAERSGVTASCERAAAEKMAAEVMWLAVKMEECGALEEAVLRWGEARGLAKLALAAEPRIQVAFVRVSAFLFKHANAKQFGMRGGRGDDEDKECAVSRYRMALLMSWLPLLCCASNGIDTPIMSSGEKAEMVKVLEEMIQKLGWEQQEEVLTLWLHHFTSCPDTDWPNLESCYTRWYSKSRDLLLFK